MRVLTQQPRGNVSVDWSNSISRGLISAFLPSQTQRPITDLVTRLQDTAVIKPVYSVGPGGIAYGSKGDGTGDDNWSIITSPSNLSFSNIGVSVLCVFETTEVGAIGTTTLWGAGFSSSDYAKIKKLADGNIRWEYSNNSGGFIVTSTPPAIRKVHVAIGTQRFGGANYREFYIDGQLISVDTSVQTNLTGSIGFIGAYTTGAPGGARVYGAFVWKRELSPQEVASLSANPWQLFRTQTSVREKLLSVAANYPLIYTPTTSIRYIPLSTPSAVDRSNPLSTDIAFAATPAHGSRDAVNSNTEVLLGNDLQLRFLTGRGGLAWNVNRYHDVDAVGVNLKNSANWTLFCVFSLETNSHSEIPIGYFLTGPSWGDNSVPRIMSTDSGYLSFGFLGNDVLVSKDIIPLRKLTTALVVGSPSGTNLYMNGILQASTTTAYTTPNFNPRYLAYSDSYGPPVAWRPWLIYMSCGWYRALSNTEIQVLSQDPLRLFARPEALNKRLIRDITFDVPQAITKSSYVQTSNIPREFVPINMAHPLARDIKFASGPVWGNRDAVNTHLTYTNFGVDTGYWAGNPTKWWYERFGRFGKVWKLYNVSSDSYVTVPAFSWSNYTLLTIVNLEADNYPLWPEMQGKPISHISNGNTSFEIALTRFGNIALYWNANSRQKPYYVANAEIVPLRKLAVVVATVNSTGSYVYINGKLAGTTSEFYPSEYGNNTTYSRYRGSADNWINNTAIETYFNAAWNRSLSSTEVQQISENPWQIFQQPSKFKNRYAEAVEAVLDISRKFLLFFG